MTMFCAANRCLLLAAAMAIILPQAASAQQVQFSSTTDVATGTTDLTAVALADFDRDGMKDIVALGEGVPSKAVILRGMGARSFSLITPQELTGFSSARAVAAGDFNRDGKPDLAIGAGLGVWIFLNTSTGAISFAAQATLPTVTNAISLALGDFDCDGKLDIAAVPENSDEVRVFRGNGDGTFDLLVTKPAGGAKHVAAIDINRDGKDDIAIASARQPDNVYVYLRTANGFNGPLYVDTSTLYSLRLAAADVNLDGKPDLAAANGNSVSIYHGNGNGTFAPEIKRILPGAGHVVIGDLHGDGKPDLAVSNYEVAVFRNEGAGTFPTAPQLVTGSNVGPTRDVAIGDFDCDGRPDLVTAHRYNQNVVRIRWNASW